MPFGAARRMAVTGVRCCSYGVIAVGVVDSRVRLSQWLREADEWGFDSLGSVVVTHPVGEERPAPRRVRGLAAAPAAAAQADVGVRRLRAGQCPGHVAVDRTGRDRRWR
jgi:hypothetical protein